MLKESLERAGAVITEGHFVYTSGHHGSTYIAKDRIYPDALALVGILKEFLTVIPNKIYWQIDTIVGPEKGGIILAHQLAALLAQVQSRPVMGVFLEKKGQMFEATRGYDEHIRNKRILLIEDVMNSGGSIKRAIESIRTLTPTILAVATLVNRGTTTAQDLKVPRLFSLMNIKMATYPPELCPLCTEGVPVNTTYGHGKKYLEARSG